MAATTPVNKWANEYETIYVLEPTIEPNAAREVAKRMGGVITKMEGKLTSLSQWGRRRLAYTSHKHKRGVYVYMRYIGYSTIVEEVERNLRLADNIFKFQTSVLRRKIRLAEVEIDPKEVEFGELEEFQQIDEPTLAQKLGLTEQPRRQYSAPSAPTAEGGAGEDASATEGAAKEDDAVAKEEAVAPEAAAKPPTEEAAAPAAPVATAEGKQE